MDTRMVATISPEEREELEVKKEEGSEEEVQSVPGSLGEELPSHHDESETESAGVIPGGTGTPVRGGEEDYEMAAKVFGMKWSDEEMTWERLSIMER